MLNPTTESEYLTVEQVPQNNQIPGYSIVATVPPWTNINDCLLSSGENLTQVDIDNMVGSHSSTMSTLNDNMLLQPIIIYLHPMTPRVVTWLLKTDGIV
jgi:hypothetical protein